MKKILLGLSLLFLTGCKLAAFSMDFEVAVRNNTDFTVAIKTYEGDGEIHKRYIQPDQVVFIYESCERMGYAFTLTTDIEMTGIYTEGVFAGSSWRDVMQMYFIIDGNDHQIEINPNCFYLDEHRVDGMYWN